LIYIYIKNVVYVLYQAMYASVLPGEYMRGNITQMISFPSWLGKNSTTGKNERILQELRTHMRLQ
jgi:replication factor C subunit 1